MASYLARIAAAGAAARSPVKPPVSGPPVLPSAPVAGPAAIVEGFTALPDSFAAPTSDHSGPPATDTVASRSSPLVAQPTVDAIASRSLQQAEHPPDGSAEAASQGIGKRRPLTRRQDNSAFASTARPGAEQASTVDVSIDDSSTVVRLPRTFRNVRLGDTSLAPPGEPAVRTAAQVVANGAGAESPRADDKPRFRDAPGGIARISATSPGAPNQSGSVEPNSGERPSRRSDAWSGQSSLVSQVGRPEGETAPRAASNQREATARQSTDVPLPARPPLEPWAPIRGPELTAPTEPRPVKLTIGRVDVQVIHVPARPPVVRRATTPAATTDGLERRNLERFRLI